MSAPAPTPPVHDNPWDAIPCWDCHAKDGHTSLCSRGRCPGCGDWLHDGYRCDGNGRRRLNGSDALNRPRP